MPRNTSGTYTLPPGNPVTTRTLIESSWANSTLGDIASEITNSLARNGAGGMTGPLMVTDGSAGAPSITFGLETSTGLYRVSAGRLGLATLGVQRFAISGSDATFSVPVIASGNLTVGGNLTVSGTISGTFSGPLGGDGSGLTNLNASQLTSGTIPDARFPATLPAIGGANLTGLNASNISSGTLADARLSSNVALRNAANTFTSGQTISVGATSVLIINASSSPQFRLENTGASANSRNWITLLSGTSFQIRPYTDDYSTSTVALSIDRSGTTAGAVQTYGNLLVGVNQPSTGYVGIQTGGGSASGYTAFYSPSGTRVGYIGNATAFGTGDNGTIPYVAGMHAFFGRANTVPVSVSFSTTPTFNSAASNVIYFGTMTANVTSMTISNPENGAQLQIRFVQDGTGGRTVTLPSNVQVSGSLNTAANAVTWLVLTYVSSASRWEGTWTRVN